MSKHFPKKFILLISVTLLLISALAIYYFFFQSQTKTLDNFPIMVINDQTAVYQEVLVSKNKLEKNIIVSSFKNGNQQEVKIYEEIPKEIAEKASELEFSVQPQIIEEDPIILWDLGSPEANQPVKLTYKKRMEETQCAKPKYVNEMQNIYKLDPFDFNDCSKYLHIKFLDAMYKNQKRREQEEKDKVQLIQPGEAKYSEIQQKAKKKIAEQAKPTTAPKVDNSSKMSAEEAIAAIKKCQYSEYQKWGLDCKATYSPEDQGWRVICGRRNFKSNNYTMNFHYEYYLVKDGKCKQLELYESVTDYNGYTFPTTGKPMWGIQ